MLGRGVRIARCLVARTVSRATVARGIVPTPQLGLCQYQTQHAYLLASWNHPQKAFFSTDNGSGDKAEEDQEDDDEGEGKNKNRLPRREYNEQYKAAAKKQLDYLKKDVELGTKIRKKCRNLNLTTVKAMKVKIQFFRDELSITQDEFKRLFKKGGLGRVLHLEAEECVLERVKFLLNLFNNDKEVVRSLLLRYPAIVTEPLVKVKAKVDYLRSEVFASDETLLPLQLEKCPQLLLGSYSLELYIKPEILALKKAGHDPALHFESLDMGKKEGEEDAL